MTAETEKPQRAQAPDHGKGAADRDRRGRYGFGRPAHGSDPGVQYGFGERRESRR